MWKYFWGWLGFFIIFSLWPHLIWAMLGAVAALGILGLVCIQALRLQQEKTNADRRTGGGKQGGS